MELFDILQTAEEVSGIDMKAVLQAMGISVNVKEHTEQEQALICSFVSNFITLPAWRVDKLMIVSTICCFCVRFVKGCSYSPTMDTCEGENRIADRQGNALKTMRI